MIIKLQWIHPTLITKGIEGRLRDYNNDKIRIISDVIMEIFRDLLSNYALLAGNNKISCLHKTFKISRQYKSGSVGNSGDLPSQIKI